MKKIFGYTLLISLFFLIVSETMISCANIIPPSGGAKDTIPPKLFIANPKDSIKKFTGNKITLLFNEYIEVKDIMQNLIVSPNPKNQPLVEYKLNTVTIKLKDSLEANTTYTLDFGNSIRDVNEGNIAKDFSYIFSTGNFIDSNTFKGKAFLAETGKIDTTLIVVLHKNLNDTAIIKDRPRYYTKIDGKGNFKFKNLPKGLYNIFVVPNDFIKKYDDSTKLFAFADSAVSVPQNKVVTLYAFEEAKRKSKITTNTPAPRSLRNENRLRYTTNLSDGKQDLLNDTLKLSFNKKLKLADTSKIILTDSNFKKVNGYQIYSDTGKSRINIIKKWKEDQYFAVIIPKDAVTDTSKNTLPKADTLKFQTRSESEYGSIHLIVNNLDTALHPILQLLTIDNKMIESIPITKRNIDRKLFVPGEYEMRILYDRNNNGIWDAGNYKKKLQPEIVRPIEKKLSVRANFSDTETEISLP